MTFLDRLREQRAKRLSGVEKSLYDLHPELLDRQPILRAYSDEAAQAVGQASAAQAYAYHGWTHRAIDVISTNLRFLPVRVVSDPDGKVIDGHPLTQVFKDVNGAMAASDLWDEWTINMLLGGECGLELVKAGSTYRELWPHPGSEFDVRVQRGQARYGNVLGYRITDNQGDPYGLPPAEMLHFKFHNPLNPWRGLAPINAVRIGILIDQFAQAWSEMFFKNSGRPDFAVITPQGLTRIEREEIEAKLMAKFGGVTNAHRPIVLEQGITDIKTVSYPPKDTEWMSQRQLSREEVGAIFGVPAEIMGFGKDTYQNMKFALSALYQLTILPLCWMRDEQLTNFFQRYGALKASERFATDVSKIEVLQQDKGPKIMQAQQLFSMGYPPNLINEKLGLDLGEIDGGNVGYLPLSLMPANYLPGTRPPEPEPAPSSPAPESPMPSDQAPQETPQEQPPAKAIGKSIEYGSPLHKQIWLLFKARTEGRERGMVRLLKKEWQKQESDILDTVRAADKPADLKDKLIDREQMDAAWRDAFEGYVTDTVQAGGDHGVEQTGAGKRSLKIEIEISFDIHNPAVQKLLHTLLWDFSAEVGDTTQAELEKLLSLALKEGWTIPQLQEGLVALYDGFKGARSEVVARTETIRAFNGAALEGYRQAGAPKKEWIASLDDRVRPDHEAAHGQIQNAEDPFSVGGESLQFPGDPAGSPDETVNCRCALAPVIEE